MVITGLPQEKVRAGIWIGKGGGGYAFVMFLDLGAKVTLFEMIKDVKKFYKILNQKDNIHLDLCVL